MLVRFGVKNVTSVAISIAAPAQTIPLRAVSGWLIRCSPMMKKKIVTMYTGSMTKERSTMSGPLARLLSAAVEHLEDPFSDHVTTGDVCCTENYCDEPDHLLCRRRGKAERYHCPNEHDSMDEVRAAHQRCVQDGGDPANDNVTSECRQHCDVYSGPERRDLKHEEFRAEAPDLFAHSTPDIVRLDHGAKPLGGGDRHKTGNPRTEDEHRCRSDRARGRCQHWEKLGAVVGANDRCCIPAGRCLGTQRVHALGAGNPRDKLKGKGGDIAVAHPCNG